MTVDADSFSLMELSASRSASSLIKKYSRAGLIPPFLLPRLFPFEWIFIRWQECLSNLETRVLFVSKISPGRRNTATDRESTVLGGTKISGADIRDQNGKYSLGYLSMDSDTTIVLATQAIANVVKSSFGPSGLDKMMVDDIGVGRLNKPFADVPR